MKGQPKRRQEKQVAPAHFCRCRGADVHQRSVTDRSKVLVAWAAGYAELSALDQAEFASCVGACLEEVILNEPRPLQDYGCFPACDPFGRGSDAGSS